MDALADDPRWKLVPRRHQTVVRSVIHALGEKFRSTLIAGRREADRTAREAADAVENMDDATFAEWVRRRGRRAAGGMAQVGERLLRSVDSLPDGDPQLGHFRDSLERNARAATELAERMRLAPSSTDASGELAAYTGRVLLSFVEALVERGVASRDDIEAVVAEMTDRRADGVPQATRPASAESLQ